MGLGPVQPSKSPDFPEDRSLDNNSARKEENGTIQKTNSVSARRFGKGRNELKSEKGFRENLSSNQASQQSDQTPEQQVATKEVPLEEKPPTEESSQETPQEVNQRETNQLPPLVGREIEQHEAPDISDFAVSILEAKPQERDSEETFHASNGIKTHPPKIDEEEVTSSSSQPRPSEDKVESDKGQETKQVNPDPHEIKPKEKHVEFRITSFNKDTKISEVHLGKYFKSRNENKSDILLNLETGIHKRIEAKLDTLHFIEEARRNGTLVASLLPEGEGGEEELLLSEEQFEALEKLGSKSRIEFHESASDDFKKRVDGKKIAGVKANKLSREQFSRLQDFLDERFALIRLEKLETKSKEEQKEIREETFQVFVNLTETLINVARSPSHSFSPGKQFSKFLTVNSI